MGEPTIEILGPSDEARLELFLLPRIESSMFLLGNMRAAGLVDRGEPYQGTYAALVERAEIEAVVAHYWNGNLVFQAPGHENPLWRAAVEASQRPIEGLLGPNDQIAVAKGALGIDRPLVKMDEKEKLYSLDLDELIVPDLLASGQVSGRRIAPGDLVLLMEWRAAYSVETLGAKEDPELWERSRAVVERSLEQRTTWVLERDGEPVACSSFNAMIEEAVQVGGVWTPPALRRQGYGRSAVAVSLLDAQAEGAEKAILFTGEGNIPAQRAYTALGFRHVGDYRIVLLESPMEVD